MKLIQSNNIFIIVLFITITGIISIIYNPSVEKQCEAKWNKLQAQQASLNTLYVAKELLTANLLKQNCLNTEQCPFWSSYTKVRLTDKYGAPNKDWWNKNAYKLTNFASNAKFIVVKLQNNLYKIIACAEDNIGKQSIISSGYFTVNPTNP